MASELVHFCSSKGGMAFIKRGVVSGSVSNEGGVASDTVSESPNKGGMAFMKGAWSLSVSTNEGVWSMIRHLSVLMN